MTTAMARHFTTPQLIRAAIPTICTVLFVSIYRIVDGLFVSNFAGTTAFAAVNLIMPFIMILATTGTMIGTGGSALISATRGAGNKELACAQFTLFVLVAALIGTAFALIGAAVMRPVCQLLGTEAGTLQDLSVLYGTISMVSLPAFILEYAFQTLFVTAGKPKLGFGVVLAAGCTNIVLDAVFVGVWGWGVAGAAWATVASEYIGGVVPLVYFARKNSSHLRLLAPAELRRAFATAPERVSIPRLLGKAFGNGSSEMVANIAESLVSMLYNLQLMRFAGENGVAAYGIIMYVFMVFTAVYLGFSMACEPLVGYQHEARRADEVGSLLRKSLAVNALAGCVMVACAQAGAEGIAHLFVGYDPALESFAANGFRLYSLSFLIMGLNIYASGFFTALGNGKVSALIAFLRTFVFEAGSVLALPLVWGTDGIWFSIDVAECAALIVSLLFIVGLRTAYGYSLRPHVRRG